MTTLELRAKRNKAWEAAKNFLDSHRTEKGVLSAEDGATYDRMEQDITDLTREIDRLNRQKEIEDSKSDIGWGSQIRSYVLDDARIKDLRTGVECRDTNKVLNGDLDQFIEASLKSGL